MIGRSRRVSGWGFHGPWSKGRNVQDFPISPLLGTLLFVFGAALVRSHVLAWRKQKHDEELDDNDRKYYYRRYRRRVQTSGMIAVLGVIIPLELLIPRDKPLVFTAYCVVILIMAMWIVVLGIGDFIATRAHIQAALARVRGKRLSLEKQLSELKSHGRNGHHDT